MNRAHADGESSYIDVVIGAAPPAQWRFPLAVHAALSVLRKWVARGRQRDELRELDHRMLRDIGITREQARKEARKPFWLEPFWLE